MSTTPTSQPSMLAQPLQSNLISKSDLTSLQDKNSHNSLQIPKELNHFQNGRPKSYLHRKRCIPYVQLTPPFPFDIESLEVANAHPAAGPYSQAIATPSTIYCSGQIPCKPTGEILTLSSSSVTEMTTLCIKNLEAVLKAAGSSLVRFPTSP